MPHYSHDAAAYDMAQTAIALLKGAIHRLLLNHPEGARATDIGRALGVNADHLGGRNEGWLQWTVLRLMEIDGTVEQSKAKGPWRLRKLA